MKFARRRKNIPPPGEWFVLSLTTSVSSSSIMWYLHSALWGIAAFLVIMAVCWIHYYNKKQKYRQEENDV